MQFGFRVIFVVALVAGCASPPAKITSPTISPTKPGLNMGDYMFPSGEFEVRGELKSGNSLQSFTVSARRTCKAENGSTLCASAVSKDIGGKRSQFEFRTIGSGSGIVQVHYKDDKGEKDVQALLVPSPDKLPHRWTRTNDDDTLSECFATHDQALCAGGIRVHCESISPNKAIVSDERIHCPNRGESHARRTSAVSPQCELILDITYTYGRKRAGTDSVLPPPRPRSCNTISPLGWTRKTPNRDWSVAMPGRAHIVFAPKQWTIEVHDGDTFLVAYEGTGPHATVTSDSDIPLMVEHIRKSLNPALGITVGKPRKLTNSDAVDWEIPLVARGGGFGGAFRIVAQGGRMISLMATGINKHGADTFLRSLSFHDTAFVAETERELTAFADFVDGYQQSVCACKDVDCARKVPATPPPTRGFPNKAQRARVTASAAEAKGCIQRLTDDD